jgi:hypothetical protein
MSWNEPLANHENEAVKAFATNHGPLIDRVGEAGFKAFLSRAKDGDPNAIDEINDRLSADTFLHKIADLPDQLKIWHGMVSSFTAACKAMTPLAAEMLASIEDAE